MKVTKEQLKQLIREELLTEWSEPEYTPEEQPVIAALEALHSALLEFPDGKLSIDGGEIATDVITQLRKKM